jgi:phosphopantothenoylcysteine decarboxylase/phosphopantothenate--cysteine ligase
VSEFERDPMPGAWPGEPPSERFPISHLALVERAELYVIAPASANTVAKLAHGLADNLLTTAALAAKCPVVVAPAMNDKMYMHPATQANLAALKARGATVVPPAEGELASHGEHGIGRLAEPAELMAEFERVLHAGGDERSAAGPWSGIRVLVTAGGTREAIDSVRFIGNRSSGRMGLALAVEAAERGADVTLIAANVALPPPTVVQVVEVQSAAGMKAACEEHFAACDVLLMAAAVADFRPAAPAERKLKKDDGPPAPIELELTEDILGALSAIRRAGQTIVGFAAEHGDGAVAYGRDKLTRKHLDAIVINDISRAGIGFDAADNEVVIVSARGERAVARSSKRDVAREVLEEVDWLRSRREGADGADEAGAGRVARV